MVVHYLVPVVCDWCSRMSRFGKVHIYLQGRQEFEMNATTEWKNTEANPWFLVGLALMDEFTVTKDFIAEGECPGIWGVGWNKPDTREITRKASPSQSKND